MAGMLVGQWLVAISIGGFGAQALAASNSGANNAVNNSMNNANANATEASTASRSGGATDSGIAAAPVGGAAPADVTEHSAGDDDTQELRRTQAAEAEHMQDATAKTVRRFHEVLDELLAEFGFDVKSGQVAGLKNLAVRKVTVSDTLPRSYGEYVELLVAERLRENSRIRLISCLSCRTKTSRIIDGRLLISSPQTNMAEMNRAAEQLGIDYFMDVVLVYHTTHMVLAFQVFNTQSKEMVWARTYNSETIKTRYQKLAIDFSQVGMTPITNEYKPEYRVLLGLGGASLPNVAGTAADRSFINLHLRSTEKFDNRRSEFGLLTNIFIKTDTIIRNYPVTQATAPDPNAATPAETTKDAPQPYRFALNVMGIYSYNFLGSIESYNEIRSGMNLGIGVLLASGYLAGNLRIGYDAYFGRRFGLALGAFYILPSQILVNQELQATKGGVGAELVFAFNL